MPPFPPRYRTTASGQEAGVIQLNGPGLPALATAAPAEFDGPGDHWSPETLLIGAVADCLILTFRAIARASQLPWSHLECEVDGTVDRVDRVTRFTELHLRARLRVPAGTNEERALRLLHKAEENCLVTRSMTATAQLEAKVEVETEAGAPAGSA
jgi:peroxiredoxin-like protein